MIKIIKNRSDIGAGTRGSDIGVDAIEIAAINKGSSYFHTFPYVDVATHNETIYQKNHHTFAKRIEKVNMQCSRLAASIKDSLHSGYFPLVLSGDHSSALGTISGIKQAYPSGTLGVIWIDAHADLHSPYTSPSGNVHGMPLAAALGIDNKKCQINAVDNETALYWNQLKNTGYSGPKLEATHLVYFGLRDTEEPEDVVMSRLGIINYSVAEVRFRGLMTCVEESLERLAECDMIYISFDIDSVESFLIGNGTGTPVAKGFDPDEVLAIIKQILLCGKVMALEIAEVNPLLDKGGNTAAEVAFDIIDELTNVLILHEANQ